MSREVHVLLFLCSFCCLLFSRSSSSSPSSFLIITLLHQMVELTELMGCGVQQQAGHAGQGGTGRDGTQENGTDRTVRSF